MSLREKLYRTEAIILSRRELGEADRILTIFTPHLGKRSVIAKGSRKARSRSGPHIDVLFRTQLDLARGRDLDVVTSAQVVEVHERFRTDLDAFCAASYLAELVRNLTEEHQEHVELYHLLQRSLTLLNDDVDSWQVLRHFELALLSLLGYKPELYQCVSCGTEIAAQPNAWSPALGGVVCASCASSDRSLRPISVNSQKYLRTLDRGGAAAVARISLTESELTEIERLMGEYIRYVAERDFGSLRVLSAIRIAQERAHIAQ